MTSTMGKRIRHFVGAESSTQLAFIDDLHQLGLNSTVELPELVVVGDQNTGKSSVLQAITEISFPVEAAMCTRFPIKISFRQTHSSKTTVLATIHPGPFSECDDALIKRTKEFRLERDKLTVEVMDEIVREATQRIFGEEPRVNSGPKGRNTASPMVLSDATLRIERSGPHEMHWTIVDLPGLVQNGEQPGDWNPLVASAAQTDGKLRPRSNAAIAEGLVRTYLSNERNIVLVVVDCVDVERHRSLKLIEQIPGLRNRSIGVLTHCDRKQETSDQWMIKLLRNELPTVCPLDHGWFGLRNRKPIEKDISDAERDENERDEFSKPEWAAVPKGRTGIKSLMTYIDKERRSQLQKSLPQIIQEINRELLGREADLKKLGEERTSTQAQRFYVHRFCTDMQKMADAALASRYQDIPSTDPKKMLRLRVQERLDQFYVDMFNADIAIGFTNYAEDLRALRSKSSNPQEWEEMVRLCPGLYSEIYKESETYRSPGLAGTIHPDVEQNIFRKQCAHWERIAGDLVEEVKVLVKECSDILLRVAIPDSKTRLEVSRITAKMSEAWNRQIDASLQDLIDDHQKRPMSTRDPRLKYESELAERQRGETLLDGVAWRDVNGQKSPLTANVGDARGAVLGREGPGYISTLLSQVLLVRARLESYYRIALNRFVDNVAIQIVERHVLGPNCPIRTVSPDLFLKLSDEDLRAVAGEDESNSTTRARLEGERSRYQEALDNWERVRLL